MIGLVNQINKYLKDKKELEIEFEELENELKLVAESDYNHRKTTKEKFLNLVYIRKKIMDFENSSRHIIFYNLYESIKNPLIAPRRLFILTEHIIYKLFHKTKLVRIAHLIRLIIKKLSNEVIPIEKIRYSASAKRQNYIRNKMPFIKSNNNFADNPRKSDLSIAVIMDKFSFDCFKYEANLITFTPENWKEVLGNKKPAFLLVESAWRGHDYSWLGHINDLEKRQDSELPALVRWCQAKGIKTVFWNKEDPPNYKRFISAAKLFDYVFTTDLNCIEKYKIDLGHENVFSLPFAAQPKIHNPVGSFPRIKDVAFAGSWYENKHDERRKQMEYLLEPALEYNLEIFDRNYSVNSAKLRFPKRYQPYIIGELSYEEMVYAYKIYKIFLNVNSVTESPTMFSRRVFEILASGACIISSYSKGIEESLGTDIIKITNSYADTKKHLDNLLNNKVLIEKLAHLGMRKVLKSHTYENRLKSIIKSIDLNNYQDKETGNGVSVIAFVKSKESLNGLLENYYRQDIMKKELFILYNTGDINEDLLNKTEKENIYFFDVRDIVEINLNELIKKAKHNFIAIFDENCFYGKHYLSDLIIAFDYCDASIVGKAANYTYFKDTKMLTIINSNMEHCYTSLISFSTLLVKKKVFQHIQFKLNIDTLDNSQMLNEFITKGFKIYSADKYNFICIKTMNEKDILGTYEKVKFDNSYMSYIEEFVEI